MINNRRQPLVLLMTLRITPPAHRRGRGPPCRMDTNFRDSEPKRIIVFTTQQLVCAGGYLTCSKRSPDQCRGLQISYYRPTKWIPHMRSNRLCYMTSGKRKRASLTTCGVITLCVPSLSSCCSHAHSTMTVYYKPTSTICSIKRLLLFLLYMEPVTAIN